MHHLKNIILKALLLFIFQLIHFNLSAQNILPDSIEKKMRWYSLQKPTQVLFAHFDKTIYAQNENVWFTAYLLNRKNSDNPQVLSVSLINDLSKAIVLEQKFLMADGISFGNVFLPDTIPAGNYSFMLYTNQLFKGKPGDVFVQPITIAATNELTFKTSLNLDTTKVNNANRKAILTVVTKDGMPIQGAAINYSIGDIRRPLITGNAKTDNEGKYYIPISQTNADNNILDVQVKYNKDLQNVKLIIPSPNKQILVKFYPEGGYLVHAIASWVGWEIKTKEGSPMKATGILYKDNISVDTIETDSYGMGKFKLIPLKGSAYAVKLITSDYRDSIFKLPEILLKSPTISIANSLANDTLKIRLTSKYPENVTVLVHNFGQIFYAFPAKTNAVGKTVLIDLKILPKGLATITVLDSAQRPCAERLFFAHYNKRSLIDIQTDKSQYAKREKVKLTLKFKTVDTGLVSVACVQSNRMQIKNSNDIESYVYLKHELANLPLKEKYMGISAEDKAYLEKILLIKGWRRYKWQEMMEISAADTISVGKSLLFSGFVTQSGAPIRKPVRLVIVTDSSTNTVTTNEKGYFILKNSWLLTNPNKNVRFMVMAKNEESYKVTINDPYVEINQKIAHGLHVTSNPVALNRHSLGLAGIDHAISLKEVKITANKDLSLRQTTINPRHGQNACGDYVCRYNILNCVNHAKANDNRAAVVGETYIGFNGIPIVYKECGQTGNQEPLKLTTMKGLNYASEFYGSDYSVISPSQPEYYSTIFWKHLVLVNASDEVQLNFYTSDITGSFKVIVQGVTRKDVVYQEKEFMVK
jgi:hypothetical protein